MGDEQLAGRTDADLVAAACAGDQQAFAALYDRYSHPVSDFVVRMTRDRDEAADIVQDTFLKAMTALGGLQQGASFKSWLFSIARNTTLNRLQRSVRTVPMSRGDVDTEAEAYDAVDTTRLSDPAQAAEATAMAALVWEAARGLDPRQLTILDLHLRQGLEGAEIATVLGVTPNNGYVMLNRLKKAVEEAIGAFLILRDGRKNCPELQEALATVDVSTMTPRVRKLVDRHVSRCETCGERRKKLLSPLTVFGAFAPVAAPPDLHGRIAAAITQQWPGASVSRAGTPAGADDALLPLADAPLAGTAASPRSRRGLQTTLAAGFVAAVLGVLLLVPESPLALTSRGGGEQPPLSFIEPTSEAVASDPSPTFPGERADTPSATSTDAAATSTATPSATDTQTPSSTAADPAAPGATTAPVDPSPASTPSPTTSASPTPVDEATVPPPTNTPVSTPTRVATPAPTATTPPCEPSLRSNVSVVNLGSRTSGEFVLLNTANCPANVTLAVTTGESWLGLAVTSLAIGANDAETIDLYADRGALAPGQNSGQVVISAEPGGHTIEVGVLATGPAATPTPQPTNTPAPGGSFTS